MHAEPFGSRFGARAVRGSRSVPPRAVLRRLRGALRAPALAGLALLAAACSGDETAGGFAEVDFPEPETTLDYEVELTGVPREAAEEDLRGTLTVFRRQEDGAPSLPILERRAERDVEGIKTVLGSYGYYAAQVEVEVEERAPAPAGPEAEAGLSAEGDEIEAQEPEPAEPRERALVRLKVDAGPPFILKRHELRMVQTPEGPPITVPEAGAQGSPVGERAAASGILQAESRTMSYLQAHGRPWARLRGRRAVIDPETRTMRVVSRIAPGPYAEYGDISVEGRDQVAADYIRTYRTWEEGSAVDRRQLREYQGDLMNTQLFDSVIVDVPEDAPEDGADPRAPITVRVEEGPARTLSAGLRYNTDTGPELRGGFVHRNLFNEGERLEIEAQVGLESQRLTFSGRKPQFLRPGQDLTTSLELRNEQSDAYDELGVTYGLGLERMLTEEWTVGLGGLLEYSRIDDEGEEQDVFLFGVPGFVRYDGTDDLLNPTEGVRARVTAAPYGGTVDGEQVEFLQTEVAGSAYLALNEAHDLVLAARGRLGSVISRDFDDVPATHRLYSGGGGSVRGYQERFIGPLDDDNDPIGGRSVAEMGVELRAPVTGDIGAALFVEGGTVSRDLVPDLGAGARFAAGGGLRYYSPVGPIRFDVGVPLNPRDVDDPFALYFSIGQAY